MSTGRFENFAGTITDIGPLYPFVGSEMFLVIAAVIFWLWWHWAEMRIEKREYEEESEGLTKAAIENRLDEQ
ncbi:MAG: hypothetical protein AAF384_12300 [Pseudomonadota bacterium]